MKCQCKKEMELIAVWDNPDDGHAWNLYTCECGRILKEDVWDQKGERVIELDNRFYIRDQYD